MVHHDVAFFCVKSHSFSRSLPLQRPTPRVVRWLRAPAKSPLPGKHYWGQERVGWWGGVVPTGEGWCNFWQWYDAAIGRKSHREEAKKKKTLTRQTLGPPKAPHRSSGWAAFSRQLLPGPGLLVLVPVIRDDYGSRCRTWSVVNVAVVNKILLLHIAR